MTLAQKKLRELRERQSKERGRMAELAVADELTDETRAELDAMEKGTADLERQLRAATVAVENEETEQRDAAATGNKEGLDTEDRERLELRSKARMGRYVLAAMENRSVDGAEGELNAAVPVTLFRHHIIITLAIVFLSFCVSGAAVDYSGFFRLSLPDEECGGESRLGRF